MAKKKTTKAPAASKKTAKKKAAGKKQAPAKHSHDEQDVVEFELDAVSTKAVELAESSDAVCDELEKVVTEVVSKAVRDVFKRNGITLNQEQAQNVAIVLFNPDVE